MNFAWLNMARERIGPIMAQFELAPTLGAIHDSLILFIPFLYASLLLLNPQNFLVLLERKPPILLLTMNSFKTYLKALTVPVITPGGVFVNSSGQSFLGPAVTDLHEAREIAPVHSSIFLCTPLSCEALSIQTVLGLKSPRHWPHQDQAFNA